MAAQADTAHLFAESHQNPTTLQNNHHAEQSEIEWNGSLTTTELKKPHLSRLVGVTHTQSGLVPHPCVVDKNLGVTSWQQGVLGPCQTLPSLGFQFQEDKSPQLLAANTSRD